MLIFLCSFGVDIRVDKDILFGLPSGNDHLMESVKPKHCKSRKRHQLLVVYIITREDPRQNNDG